MQQAILPPNILLDPLLKNWLLEDIGRGDRTSASLLLDQNIMAKAQWRSKESGVIAGGSIGARVFQLLDDRVIFRSIVKDGDACDKGTIIAEIEGPLDVLLMGERVALNLAMRLSGIATATKQYVECIADLPVELVDTRKTTPGLRILEKYATQCGGGRNHRLGLDDAIMIKDNHIVAAGNIGAAISRVRAMMPYPLSIEVETESLADVAEALQYQVEMIMLDNMSLPMMIEAVNMIRQQDQRVKIEASGNITLANIRDVAKTGVDYISTSAPITRSNWLDLSMKILS